MDQVGFIFADDMMERTYGFPVEARRNFRYHFRYNKDGNSQGTRLIRQKPFFAGNQCKINAISQAPQIGKHHCLCPANFGARNYM